MNCSDISLERIWGHVDVFAASHFFGWIMKALLVRHYGILWTISVMWEITEVKEKHFPMIPVIFLNQLCPDCLCSSTSEFCRVLVCPILLLILNFQDIIRLNLLRWDAIILDILLCNGLGIWVGMKLCHYLEMREYKWESIKELHSTSDKIKRAVLQFTPESWTHVRWLDPHSSYMRFLAVCQLVVFWQITELNTFFLKHIFELPPSHMLNLWRLVVVGLIVAPSVR